MKVEFRDQEFVNVLNHTDLDPIYLCEVAVSWGIRVDLLPPRALSREKVASK